MFRKTEGVSIFLSDSFRPRLCENSERKNNMLMRVLCFIFCNTLLAYNRTPMRVFGRSLSPKIVFPRPGSLAVISQQWQVSVFMKCIRSKKCTHSD